MIALHHMVMMAACPLMAQADSKLPEKYQGQRLLVRFGGSDADAEKALGEAKATVVEKIAAKTFLLDFGADKPKDVLERLPKHEGAIVFQDGAFKEALGYKNRKGITMVPQPYACLRWGSNANAMKQMEQDVERCSKLPGVRAEKINNAPGKKVFGNPWILKLTPTDGNTLLQVFVQAKAGFDYREDTVAGR
jgi:hypothetical protein